jgi:hypothetical protein
VLKSTSITFSVDAYIVIHNITNTTEGIGECSVSSKEITVTGRYDYGEVIVKGVLGIFFFSFPL